MNEDFFPITYTREDYRTPFLTGYCNEINLNFKVSKWNYL